MNLEFIDYLKAGYPLIWIDTVEPYRIQDELIKRILNIKSPPHEVFSWDISSGIMNYEIQKNADTAERAIIKQPEINTYTPSAPIEKLDKTSRHTVCFVHNYHKFLQSIEIVQKLLNLTQKIKSEAKMFVIISPVVNIPPELEKWITVIDHSLPTIDALKVVAEDVAKNFQDKIEINESVLNAALGLTTFEAENAFALSTVATQGKSFSVEVIAEQKAQMIRKSAALELSRFTERFADLCGLERLKNFALNIIKSPLAKGIILLGPPGVGKSHIAKALGTEAGIPALCFDLGSVFAGLVGQSEHNIREALKIADAMAPCVLFLDELEKAVSGVRSSHLTDGGTGTRIMGTFLTWLSDHTSRVFPIATVNNISLIPPEFLRAERWDAKFFIDFPGQETRDAILELYAKKYEVEIKNKPNMEDWSGAEIKTLCRIAKMLNCDLEGAAKYVIPISATMKEEVASLREWAKERAVPAEDAAEVPTVFHEEIKKRKTTPIIEDDKLN